MMYLPITFHRTNLWKTRARTCGILVSFNGLETANTLAVFLGPRSTTPGACGWPQSAKRGIAR